MNMQLLKAHWVFSLNNVIVAGGFFRDNFLGVPINDIDIYCTPANEDNVRSQLHHRVADDITVDMSKKRKLFTRLSVEEQSEIQRHYSQQKSLDIQSVHKLRTWQGELLDLIVTEKASSAKTLIDEFDYTVNSVAWPGTTGQIAYNNSFVRDLWGMYLNPVRESTNKEREKYMISKGFKLQ